MSITKRYYVGISGTDSSTGYIELTEEEADAVRKCVDTSNWVDANLNPFSRKFFIIEDNKDGRN